MRYTLFYKKIGVIFLVILITILIYKIYTTRFYILETFHTNTSIPKHVWQTYKTKVLPVQAAEMQQTWRDNNPGWSIELYDDNDIDIYIKSSWDENMYTFFKALPLGVMKADLWRYLILTTHGGVYSDIDSRCILPIDKWFYDFSGEHSLVVSPEKSGEENLCQWTMYCTKEHPAMRFVCSYILENYMKHGINTSYEHFVHETTGPTIWTRAIKAYLDMNDLTGQQMYDNYTIDSSIFVKKGIYILSAEHFQGIYSKNMYGSLFFGDNYVRWTDEKDKIVKNAIGKE